MPDDATEGVAKHSSRLQPSINLHVPVKAFMFSCSGADVLPQREEAQVSLVQSIEPHRILAPTRDLNQGPKAPLPMGFPLTIPLTICTITQSLTLQFFSTTYLARSYFATT